MGGKLVGHSGGGVKTAEMPAVSGIFLGVRMQIVCKWQKVIVEVTSTIT
jgi:hypothetical protein